MARAYRELHLALGELPVHRGYPVSLFGELPCIIERAGGTSRGSVTAVYTVLTESERVDADPLAEELKSLLDGHIVLSHELAERGIRPALNINRSLSRCFEQLHSSEYTNGARNYRRYLYRLEGDRELAAISPRMDNEYLRLQSFQSEIFDFLQQDSNTPSAYPEGLESLMALEARVREGGLQ